MRAAMPHSIAGWAGFALAVILVLFLFKFAAAKLNIGGLKTVAAAV